MSEKGGMFNALCAQAQIDQIGLFLYFKLRFIPASAKIHLLNHLEIIYTEDIKNLANIRYVTISALLRGL